MSKEKGFCEVCGTEIEVQICCSGHMCCCYGLPVDPLVCSGKCYDTFMSKEYTDKKKQERETAFKNYIIMNKICYLFGHKTGDLNDSGYPVCERCNSHSYYDDWNWSGKAIKPFMFIVRIYYKSKYNLQHWYDCKFNGNKLPF